LKIRTATPARDNGHNALDRKELGCFEVGHVVIFTVVYLRAPEKKKGVGSDKEWNL
jgi:hypothetical protein